MLKIFKKLSVKELAALGTLALLAIIKLWISWRAASCATFLADQVISSGLVMLSLLGWPLGRREELLAGAAFQLCFAVYTYML